MVRGPKKVDVWIDIKNSHEPAFFHPFIRHFEKNGVSYFVTARDYAEITSLLDLRGIPYHKVGGHHGSNLIAKGVGRLVLRNLDLLRQLPRFKIAMGHGSIESAQIGRLRGSTTVSFIDNDLPVFAHKAQFPFVDHLLYPDYIPKEALLAQGANPRALEPYSGFKEDVYLSDFEPDPRFREKLDLEDYVIVRPEAWKAEYYPTGTDSLVAPILTGLTREKARVLLLPRYGEDRNFAEASPGIRVLESPLNGLDLCWNARAVLSGSGTMSREAALLGIPAVQFIPGRNLSVDRELEKQGTLLHTRDVAKIVRYALTTPRRPFSQARSKTVLADLIGRTDRYLVAK